MEELLKYFIRETNEKLNSIENKMSTMGDKLEDLQRFKSEMMVSSRITSLIVSGICGFLTMLASLLLVYYTARASVHP